MLNLKKLITDNPCRLRYVQRFSTCRISRTESVAEHSYYTALFAMFIARHIKHGLAIELDVIQKALMHDIEEAVTGDIPRPFKVMFGPALNGLYHQACEKVTLDMLNEITDEGAHFHQWKNAKEDTFSGRVVQFADFLSVLSYLYEESRTANHRLTQHVHEMREYFQLFEDADFDFIRELVDQARVVLDETIEQETSGPCAVLEKGVFDDVENNLDEEDFRG